MSIKKFYNYFHTNATTSTKIISKNNFTYFLIIREIEKIIKSRKKIKVLDFGCGVGTIDLYLAGLGHEVNGCDVSLKAIKIASKNSQQLKLDKLASFKVLNPSSLDTINTKFDLVICSEVLEHIKNEKVILVKLRKLLKNNGLIFISTPSNNAPLFKLGFTKKFDIKVGHLRRYSQKAIREIIIKSGFKIKEIHKSEGILRNSLFVFSPLNKIVKFIKGPLSPLINYFDKLTLLLFGESDIIILAQKI